jgi:hypothetical protein
MANKADNPLVRVGESQNAMLAAFFAAMLAIAGSQASPKTVGIW